MFEFKRVHSLEQRKRAFQNFNASYPDRFPVIVERLPSSGRTPTLEKKKFVVPRSTQFGRFIVEVRRLMPALSDTDALFFYVDSTLVPVSQSMEQIYDKHADEDGFLYVHYALENTFG